MIRTIFRCFHPEKIMNIKNVEIDVKVMNIKNAEIDIGVLGSERM